MYADTTTSLGIPTTSASGAIIGMDIKARPDDEFTKNPRITKTSIIRIMKIAGGIPATALDRP